MSPGLHRLLVLFLALLHGLAASAAEGGLRDLRRLPGPASAHPAAGALPSPEVEEGGMGAGTVIRVRSRAFGMERTYHIVVSEPEPGRVLVEMDKEAGLVTTFTVTPLEDGWRSRVVIASARAAKGGLAGAVEGSPAHRSRGACTGRSCSGSPTTCAKSAPPRRYRADPSVARFLWPPLMSPTTHLSRSTRQPTCSAYGGFSTPSRRARSIWPPARCWATGWGLPAGLPRTVWAVW